MSKFRICTQILQGNALFSGKIYTAGNFFTRPPVVTVVTNFKFASLSGGVCILLLCPAKKSSKTIPSASCVFCVLRRSNHLSCLYVKRRGQDDETAGAEGDSEDGHHHDRVLHRSGEPGPVSSLGGCSLAYEA